MDDNTSRDKPFDPAQDKQRTIQPQADGVQPAQAGSNKQPVQKPDGVQPSVVADDKQQPVQPRQQLGQVGGEGVVSVGKEQKEAFGASISKEAQPGAAVETKEFEASSEVKDWMEKIEAGEEITFPGPVTDDYGQILMDAAKITKPKIDLPLDKPGIQKGLHHKVVDSVRWLAEWCLRLIKMVPKRVVYKKIVTNSKH